MKNLKKEQIAVALPDKSNIIFRIYDKVFELKHIEAELLKRRAGGLPKPINPR